LVICEILDVDEPFLDLSSLFGARATGEFYFPPAHGGHSLECIEKVNSILTYSADAPEKAVPFLGLAGQLHNLLQDFIVHLNRASYGPLRPKSIKSKGDNIIRYSSFESGINS